MSYLAKIKPLAPDVFYAALLVFAVINLGAATSFEFSLFAALAPLYPALAIIRTAGLSDAARPTKALIYLAAALVGWHMITWWAHGGTSYSLKPLLLPLPILLIFIGSSLIPENKKRLLFAEIFLPACAGALVLAALTAKYVTDREDFTFGFFNANHFGLFLAVVSPFSLSLFLSHKNKASRIGAVYIFFLICTGIMLANARGAAFLVATGMVLMLGLYILKNRKIKKMASAAVFAAAIFVAITGLNQLDRLGPFEKEIARTKLADDWQMRKTIWEASTQVAASAPLLGVGPGMFRYHVTEYLPIGYIGAPRYAHNDYLQLAAENGLPAAVVFVSFLFLVLFLLVRALIKTGNEPSPTGLSSSVDDGYYSRAGAAVSFMLFCLAALFDFPFFVPTIAAVPAWAVPIALSAGHGSTVARLEDNPQFTSKKTPAFYARISILLSLFPLLLITAYIFEYPPHKSADKNIPSEQRIASIDKAIENRPQVADYYLSRGRILLKMALAGEVNRFDYLFKAIDSFRAASRSNPQDARAFASIADALDRLESIRIQKGFPEFLSTTYAVDAERAHRAALKLHPAGPGYRIGLVRFLYYQNSTTEAAGLAREFFDADGGGEEHFLRDLLEFEPDPDFIEQAVPYNSQWINHRLGDYLSSFDDAGDNLHKRYKAAIDGPDRQMANRAMLDYWRNSTARQTTNFLALARDRCNAAKALWAACYVAAMSEHQIGSEQFKQSLLIRSVGIQNNYPALKELSLMAISDKKYREASNHLSAIASETAFPSSIRKWAIDQNRRIKYLAQ